MKGRYTGISMYQAIDSEMIPCNIAFISIGTKELPHQTIWSHPCKTLDPPNQPNPLPSQSSPTSNREHLTIHPLTILRAEESHHARNILGQPNTVQRRPACRKLYRYIISTILACINKSIEGPAYLIDLLIGHGSLVRNVLPCRLDVHVRLDAAGSDGVDCDAFAAEVFALDMPR